MNKQELNITIDPECPDEIKANGIAWVEDACNWLLSQPRTPDATQPRFSEIKITIKPCGFSRGLRDVRDGRGSLALDTGTDLKFNILPSIIVIPTTQEISFRGNAVYLLSQLFRPDGYSQDSFRWEEHLHYQLKFLDRLAASSKAARGVLDQYEEQQAAKKEKERLAKYWQQYPDKRALQLKARKEAWKIKTPEWYLAQARINTPPCKDAPPEPMPPQPPAPPVEHPTPQISAQDQAALDVIKSQREYMASFANPEKLEDK